ncbi:hypothetical protein CAL29_23780 [Bordetella genomosp. 10]|uniref:Transmembrane protein n=1 Tax=Bordetella genomosp. 10 TaxID=1416804 RepID=A0A261S0V1_9BORD|nr:hypothetical protein [Bordetella genomosp. 10]OZI30976.1 hypothetical protein CAL29_23780 [Bordetella genomosp. 10]
MREESPEPVRRKPAPIRRDWVSKTLAGTLLGLTLAMAASGIYSQFAANTPLPIRGQLMMWMVPPIWLGTLSGVYFFTSGARAWLWLGSANAAAFCAWLLLRMT